MSELQKIWFKGKVFYVDPKLQELRQVDNPHDSYSFEEYCEIRKESWTSKLGNPCGCGTCQIHGVCQL